MSETTPTDLKRAPLHNIPRKHLLALIALTAMIYLPVMGVYGMYDPWETHYTEVARQFMENNDWLSTRWHNGVGPDGYSERNFWSKPVGSFWMSGLVLKALGFQDKITVRDSPPGHDPGQYLTEGHVEWAVRIPFFLCALFGIIGVFTFVGRIFSPRAGLIAGLVLATSPIYFMIGRQAMTDMPYVGMMSGALAFFALGVFGSRDEYSDVKSFKLGFITLRWPHALSYYSFIGVYLLTMTLIISAVVSGLIKIPFIKMGSMTISAAIVMAIYGISALVFIYLSTATRTKNEVYLYIFYLAVAIAGLSKGLIGALQPGLVILVFLLLSKEWRLLTQVALLRGLLLAASIFMPWYHGMLLRYGRSWWNELFGTEQFRRLTIGEQKQAKGTWEYYISQIGYGFFPWIAFLPAAFVNAIQIGIRKDREGDSRARLFAFIWFGITTLLFTLTMTKYHHYILPAIPPAAVIVAFYLDDLLNKKISKAWIGLLAGFILFTVVGIDLARQPAHWVWMYTYLYNINWARGVPDGPYMWIYVLASAAALSIFFAPQLRKNATIALLAVSIAVGGFVLNWHQIGCAPHWSQKYVLKSYYKLRKSPKEQLIAWQFNWRGETWYTAAQVVVSKSLKNEKIKKWLLERKGTRFFFVTERSRYGSLRSMLPTANGKKTLRIVDDTNIHYILAEAYL